VNPVEGVLGTVVLQDTDTARVAAHHYIILPTTLTRKIEIMQISEVKV
jgi:hypothetical protein